MKLPIIFDNININIKRAKYSTRKGRILLRGALKLKQEGFKQKTTHSWKVDDNPQSIYNGFSSVLALLVQLVERRFPKPDVEGSSPSGRVISSF